MKKAEIVKCSDIEVHPFMLDDFIQDEALDVTMKKVTKKELKDLAKHLDLVYNERDIVFAKKLLNAYLTGNK